MGNAELPMAALSEPMPEDMGLVSGAKSADRINWTAGSESRALVNWVTGR